MAIIDINEIANIAGNSRKAYEVLMKYLYLPIWSNWVHTAAGFISGKVAKKKGKRIGGKLALAAVTTNLPQSAGVPSMEGYPLPPPRTGTHQRPELISRSRYSRLRWTGHVERAAAMGDQAAWVAPRKKDMADARQQDGINYSTQLYLGKYDVRATVKSYDGASVVTLYDREARTSGAGSDTPRNWFKFGASYLREGMSVAFCRTSDAADTPGGLTDGAAYDLTKKINDLKISSVDESDSANPTITLALGEEATDATVLAFFTRVGFTDAAPDGPQDGDTIILGLGRKAATSTSGVANTGPIITTNGASGAAQGDYAAGNGIADVCTGTSKYPYLYGLTKSTAGLSKLQGREFHANGEQRDFGEMLLTLALQRTRSEGSGVAPKMVVMNESVLREVVKENRGARHFMPVQTESGFGRLVHTAGDMTTPYMEDWIAPPGCMIGLLPDEWEYYTDVDLQPVDKTPERWIPDYDQHEIALVEAGNVACERPHAQFILDDLRFKQFDLTI